MENIFEFFKQKQVKAITPWAMILPVNARLLFSCVPRWGLGQELLLLGAAALFFIKPNIVCTPCMLAFTPAFNMALTLLNTMADHK